MLHGVFAILATVSVACYAQSPIPGYPDNITAYDPREVGMLPSYCMYTQLFRANIPGADNQEKIAHWRSVMGPTVSGKPPYMFETMHHYCWGLMKTNRGVRLARSEQSRRFYLTTSIGEFDFVLRYAPADFVLLPEILTRKGENLLRLGEVSDGVRDLQRAIELKPDYWPPYVALSGFYAKSGKVEDARQVLKRGLAAAPNSKALQIKLEELEPSALKQRNSAPAADG